MTATKKWNEETVAKLEQIVGDETPVARNTIISASTILGVTQRSVASKLRKMGYEVTSMAKSKESSFSSDEGDALEKFVTDNANKFTYAEISEQFADGKFTPRQVQGKILALELTDLVKPTEQVVAATSYTEEESNRIVELVNSGKFMEEIAEALGRKVDSMRGKTLSLHTKGLIDKIPAMKESSAKLNVDPYTNLGEAIAEMTVAEIAKEVDKTERGVKTVLTRRGIKVADYDGEAKRAKAEAKAAA